MPLLIVLITTILFTLSGFVLSNSQSGIGNSFFVYAMTELGFIADHWLACLLGFISLTMFYILSLKLHKKYPEFKIYLGAIGQILFTVFAGFMLAYALLVVIAFVELNTFAVFINSNPASLGILTDIHNIDHQLENNTQAPQIIAADKDQYTIVQAVASATTGTDNLYGKYFLPTIPHFFVIPIKKPNASMLLIDNTLIVTQISPLDMQAISPYVGYLFVKQYFPERQIKQYPKVLFMDRPQYQTYRGVDAFVKLANIQKEQRTTEDSIASLSAAVLTDNTNIQNTQTTASQAATQKDTQYNACLADGSKTIDDCKKLLNALTNASNASNGDLQKWTQQLQIDQQQLTQLQYDDNIFKTQVSLIQGLSQNIPHEFGVYEPPNSLNIVVNTDNTHAIADYFETLVHEYLHYASYVNDKKVLADTFFEEGFTEYFARRTIKDELNTSTNLGYPVFVKIISQIAKRIPESDLADIYFTKDQTGLVNALDTAYGDGFYENNRLTFITLQYTSDPAQILQIANTIMKKIDGQPLTEKDLLSSYSNL